MKYIFNKVYRLLLCSLPKRLKRRLFIDLALFFDVTRIRAHGELGNITGSLQDTSVFLHYFQSGSFSSNITSALTHFFDESNGGTYLDIGANIGLTLVPVAKNSLVQVHGFEPEPNNFSILSENIRSNTQTQNVHLYNLALFNKDCELSFELSDYNHGDHRVRSDQPKETSTQYGEQLRKIIKVPGKRLDQILKVSDLKKPIAVKIDTQGSECGIYEGGRELFSAADFVIMEYWPYGMRRLDGDINKLLQMLSEDFSFGKTSGDHDAIDLTNLKPISEVIQQLKEINAKKTDIGWTTDLILTHKSYSKK